MLFLSTSCFLRVSTDIYIRAILPRVWARERAERIQVENLFKKVLCDFCFDFYFFTRRLGFRTTNELRDGTIFTVHIRGRLPSISFTHFFFLFFPPYLESFVVLLVSSVLCAHFVISIQLRKKKTVMLDESSFSFYSLSSSMPLSAHERWNHKLYVILLCLLFD